MFRNEVTKHVKLFELNLSSQKNTSPGMGLHLNLVGKHALGSELAKHIISQTWQCPAQDQSPPPHLLVLFHPLGPLWTQLPYP